MHGKIHVRSPRRSARPLGRDRVGRAAPSATHVSLQGPSEPEKESPQPCAGQFLRPWLLAPPSSSPPRTRESRRCGPRSPPSHLPVAPCSRKVARLWPPIHAPPVG